MSWSNVKVIIVDVNTRISLLRKLRSIIDVSTTLVNIGLNHSSYITFFSSKVTSIKNFNTKIRLMIPEEVIYSRFTSYSSTRASWFIVFFFFFFPIVFTVRWMSRIGELNGKWVPIWQKDSLKNLWITALSIHKYNWAERSPNISLIKNSQWDCDPITASLR